MTAERSERSLPLGQVLMRQGLISAGELKDALAEQHRTREPLGSILIRRNYVPAHLVLKEVAAQHRELEFVDLEHEPIDDTAAKVIPEHMALRLRSLPIGWQAGRLRVAMADPKDSFAVDEIRETTDFRVRAVLAEPGQLEAATRRFWARYSRQVAALDSHNRAHSRRPQLGESELADRADSPGSDPGERAQPAEREAEAERPRLRLAPPEPERSHETPPVVAFVDHLLTRSMEAGATDVHLDPNGGALAIRFRVDGVLTDALSLSERASRAVIDRLKVLAGLDLDGTRLPQEGRFGFRHEDRNVQARVISLPTADGESVAIRIVDEGPRLRPLDALGFSAEAGAAWKEAIGQPGGAVLVTGPARSGISTTLFSSVRSLDARAKNVVTVEQEVEVVVPGVKQIVVDLSDGPAVVAFLNSVLRADPDVVLLSEIRDGKSASAVAEAANSGHLVLGSLRVDSAAAAPGALLGMGVEPFVVASALTCVSSQRLLRRLCPACKAVDHAPPAGLIPPDGLGDGGYRRAVGCKACGGTGYRGRLAIHEVMRVSPEITDAIRERRSREVIHQIAVSEGMVPLFGAGLEKALEGETSISELTRVFGASPRPPASAERTRS